MELYGLLIKLILLVDIGSVFCAEGKGQKASFQLEDKSGDLKIAATKKMATVTAQADSVQVVVDPGTADYPVVKSDKPVVHVSGPVPCCNGRRKKSAVPSTKKSISRHVETSSTKKEHALKENNNWPFPHEDLLARSGSPKLRLDLKASGFNAKGKESKRYKIVGKFGRGGSHNLQLLTVNSLKAKSHSQGEPSFKSRWPDSKNAVNRKGQASLKSKLGPLALLFPSKSPKQTFLHGSKLQNLPGTKKTEVKGTGPSFHVTGDAGKLKMHVTKDGTDLTSESGGVDVLLKPSASGSSNKADAKARSKEAVHLATELGGNFEGPGVKKSLLSHVGQEKDER